MSGRGFISFARACLAIAWLFLATGAQAQLSFDFRTGNATTFLQSVASDSNKCPTQGPIATYVGGIVTNTGSTMQTNVAATLAGLSNGFALTGTQTGTLFLGSIAPGGTALVMWHVSYPCATKKVTPATTANVLFSSDQTPSGISQVITLTSRLAISANAGGQVISTTLGAGAIVGQILTADVLYDFGGYAVGDEFFFQPAGNTDFDAACLRLVMSEVISSNLTTVPVGMTDTLYLLANTSQSGNNYRVGMRFYFRYLCSDTVSTARPYSVQTSGNTNIKYTGNFDGGGTAIQFNFPNAPSGQYQVFKTVDTTPLPFGEGPHTVTYTVTITNPTSFDGIIDSIVDTLPAGVAFAGIAAGSDVTAANSGSLPASGATGAVTFQGLYGSSYAVPPSGSLSLVYTATVDDTIGLYTNSVEPFVGTESQGTGTVDVEVEGGELTGVKTVAHGSGDPNEFYLPGDDVTYTITLQNIGVGAADDGSVFVTDILPEEVRIFTGDFDGAGANTSSVGFVDSGSGLVCCETPSMVEYSDTVSGSFGYTPVTAYDPAIRRIRITPSGTFKGGTSAAFSFRARID